jgi:23S rRNA pseudouridine1911/1915/1917 synthase
VESWDARFDFGGVYVNGRAALADQALPFPCKVEYYEPKFDLTSAAQLFPHFEAHYIVYHDEDIAVVYKPAHLPSLPAKEQRHFSLKASLERHFQRPVHLPSRLDVSVHGLLVVSISPRAHAPLQHAFEQRRVQKGYRLATTAASPHDGRFSIEVPIGRDPRHPVLRCPAPTGGQAALTHFALSHRTTAENQPVDVIHASPVTGRTHQIRVHAAHAGIPILGDNFYGGALADSLHLLSYSVALNHPTRHHPLALHLPPALTPPWALPR